MNTLQRSERNICSFREIVSASRTQQPVNPSIENKGFRPLQFAGQLRSNSKNRAKKIQKCGVVREEAGI